MQHSSLHFRQFFFLSLTTCHLLLDICQLCLADMTHIPVRKEHTVAAIMLTQTSEVSCAGEQQIICELKHQQAAQKAQKLFLFSTPCV